MGNNMETLPKNIISLERAMNVLNDGQPLKDLCVEGEMKIEIGGVWDKEVVIENCMIEYFSGSTTVFNRPVKLINSHFKKGQFIFTHFVGGLTIENCSFDKYLDFQAGGHNAPGNLITINNNIFSEFCNFFDCWYNGHVAITNNKFQQGTNIASEKQLISFDFKPVIENNIGQLKVESEFAE